MLHHPTHTITGASGLRGNDGNTESTAHLISVLPLLMSSSRFIFLFLLLFCLVRGYLCSPIKVTYGGDSFGLLIHLLSVWRPRLYYHFFRSSSGEDKDLLPISKQHYRTRNGQTERKSTVQLSAQWRNKIESPSAQHVTT